MGRRNYVTVQISSENVLVQIHEPKKEGDKILASAHSRALLKKGWKGSRKSVPACYLTGYLAGKKAVQNGLQDAVLYNGTRRYTQRMAAAQKGVIDSGITIPSDDSAFPDENRIMGKHLQVQNDIEKIKSELTDVAKETATAGKKEQ